MLSTGCPQGSVLDPLLWVEEFDSLMRLRLPSGCRVIIAYADDGLLLIKGDSRNGIEFRATQACRVLEVWSNQHKIVFSPEKITMMLLKGRLVVTQRARVSMIGHSIRYLSLQ